MKLVRKITLIRLVASHLLVMATFSFFFFVVRATACCLTFLLGKLILPSNLYIDAPDYMNHEMNIIIASNELISNSKSTIDNRWAIIKSMAPTSSPAKKRGIEKERENERAVIIAFCLISVYTFNRYTIEINLMINCLQFLFCLIF